MVKYYCDRCKKKMQQKEPCHLFLGRFALLCDKCEEELKRTSQLANEVLETIMRNFFEGWLDEEI